MSTFFQLLQLRGFKLSHDIAEGSVEVAVPPISKVGLNPRDLGIIGEILEGMEEEFGHKIFRRYLSWKDTDVLILFTSEMFEAPERVSPIGIMGRLLEIAPRLVVKKNLTAWIVDDKSYLTKEIAQNFIHSGEDTSLGLRNPFSFIITKSSQIPALLDYLLRVSGGDHS